MSHDNHSRINRQGRCAAGLDQGRCWCQRSHCRMPRRRSCAGDSLTLVSHCYQYSPCTIVGVVMVYMLPFSIFVLLNTWSSFSVLRISLLLDTSKLGAGLCRGCRWRSRPYLVGQCHVHFHGTSGVSALLICSWSFRNPPEDVLSHSLHPSLIRALS